MACHCLSWPILGSLSESWTKKISHVFVFDGGNNCFFVTHDDDIYALGRNGKKAPLGCGSQELIRQPKRIAEFGNERIIDIVAVNDGHVVALCKSGKVFSWAWQDLHGFGTGPRQMEYEGLKFVKIAVGKSHALALSETGQVVSWGKNDVGQLGNGSTKYSVEPVEIEIKRVYKNYGHTKLKFIDIACTETASFFLTKRGRVYSSGFFETGHGQKSNIVRTPTPVIYQGMPQMRKIAASRNAVFALDCDYNLYSWGSNDNGECGLGKSRFFITPQKIEALGSLKFHDIGAHCDSDFVAAITNLGCVYVWGRTRSFRNFKTPIPTDLSVLDDAFIVYDQSRSFRLMETWIIEVGIRDMLPHLKYTVTIIINQRRIQVHSSILYRQSKYFRKLIDSGEINDNNCSHKICVVKHSVQAFNLYTEWIYNGKLITTAANLTNDVLHDLYLLAGSLPEPDFLRLLICKYRIVEEREINYRSVCFVYEEALANGNKKLKNRCLEFISKKPLCYILSNPFLYGIKVDTTRQLLIDLTHFINMKDLMASMKQEDEVMYYTSSSKLELEWIAFDDNEDFDFDKGSKTCDFHSYGHSETVESHDGEEDFIHSEPLESDTMLKVTTK